MAKRKAVIERAPDMLREPERYFDVKFTAHERDLLTDKICAVAGMDSDEWYMRLQVPTERSLCRTLDRIDWGNYDDLLDYTLIKIARDLGIDYHHFAKNVPKLPIDGFVELAIRTFSDFDIARNSTVKILQRHRLHDLWSDWYQSECPRRGCHKQGHDYCSDRFAKPNFDDIALTVANNNGKRRRTVSKDIARPTTAGAARLQLVYSRD